MDDMQVPDLQMMTKYLDFAEAAAWSQTRQIMLCSLKPYLKNKNLTADEFFPLPIDESWQAKQELTTEISNEDVAWWNNYCENYKKGQH
jgi:hypothetical protein